MIIIPSDTEYFDIFLGQFIDYQGRLQNDLTIREENIKIWKYETRDWVRKDEGGADFYENGWYLARFNQRDYNILGPMKIYVITESCMPVIIDVLVWDKSYVSSYIRNEGLPSVNAAVVADKANYTLSALGISSIWSSASRTLTAATNITSDNQKIDNAKIANLDAAISTRLATASYTAPDNASIAEIKKAALNDWIVAANQLKLFDDDKITPIATWNLFDNNGNPTMTNIYKGVRV